MAATNEPAIRMPGLTPCYLTARFTIADGDGPAAADGDGPAASIKYQ